MTAPGLLAGIAQVLAILGGATRGRLHITSQSRNGLGRAGALPLTPTGDRVHPAVLEVIESGWHADLGLAVRHMDAPLDPIALHALSVTLSWPLVYRNDRGVEKGPGSRHRVPHERVDEAIARLTSSATPPTAIIESGASVTPLWALHESIDLRRPAGRETAARALAALAKAHEADTPPEDLCAVTIPMPGTLARGLAVSYPDIARIVRLDAERRYALSDIVPVTETITPPPLSASARRRPARPEVSA